MSKELEALKKIATTLKAKQCKSLNDEFIFLLKSLTPPTAEQLCEELGEYMKEPVWLDERNEIRISTQWLVRKTYYNGEYIGLNFLVVLPPTILKRIAQFYEGEVK